MKAGLYIHTPFCRSKCDYCSFSSTPLTEWGDRSYGILGEYSRRLIREIGEWADKYGNVDADTIYFGGGTPSLLDPEDVRDIINTLRKTFHLCEDPEITLEMNPADAGEKRIGEYRGAGINRVVLGVQTLNPRLHRIIGRCGNPPDERLLEGFFRTEGILHSIDVITGIPTQTPGELIDDLRAVSSFRPEHISAYILSVDKNTPLFGRVKMDEEFEILQKKAFETVISYLTKAGYSHYEISNFSLKGRESRHNMKYWLSRPYMGFGPGAHSFMENRRFINRMGIDEYLRSGSIRLEEDVRSPNSQIVEYILTGLRLIEGFSTDDFERDMGRKLPPEAAESFMVLQREGFIEFNDNKRIKLTERGLILADRIIYRAVEPLL